MQRVEVAIRDLLQNEDDVQRVIYRVIPYYGTSDLPLAIGVEAAVVDASGNVVRNLVDLKFTNATNSVIVTGTNNL
jgi:hypothetical protein